VVRDTAVVGESSIQSLRCTPLSPLLWLCPLFQHFSNIASGWSQALTRGLVTL